MIAMMKPKSFNYLFLLICFSLLLGVSAHAEPPPPSTTSTSATTLSPAIVTERERLLQAERDMVKQQQMQLTAQSQQLNDQIMELNATPVTEATLQQASFDKQSAQLELDKARVDQQNLSTLLKEQSSTLRERQQRLDSLQASQINNADDAAVMQDRIAQLQTDIQLLERFLTVDQARIDNFQLLIDILEKKLALANRWETEVTETYQLQRKQDLESRIQQERQNYFDQATVLRQELNQLPATAAETEKQLLETQIQVAEYRAQLVADELKVNFMQESLQRLKNLLEQMPDRITESHQRESIQLKQELTELTIALSNRMAVLQQQLLVSKQQAENLDKLDLQNVKREQKALTDLIKDLQQQLVRVTEVHLSLLPLEDPLTQAYSKNLRNRLMQRRQLPDNIIAWKALLNDVLSVPQIFWHQAEYTIRGFVNAFQQVDEKRWLLIFFAVLIWLSIVVFARHHLLKIFNHLNAAADTSSSARSLMIFLRLLHLNKVGIAFTGMLLLMIWLAEPPYPSVLISITLACFWLSIKFPINLTWLILLDEDKLKQAEPEDVVERFKLYKQLRWMVVLASSLIVITILAHMLPIAPTVQDLIDSGFMLFLSITVFPVMRIRSLLIRSLKEKLRSYWLWVIRITTLMIPLAILAVAILGLIGYLNLGWYVAWRLSLFLLIFFTWLISRGLLDDIITFLKNFSLRHSQYGLLWTQDIIPLFDKLLGVGVAISAIFLLFWINGWFNDEVFMDSVRAFFDYTVFTVNETNISIANVLLSLFTLWSVFWFSGWAKRVTYRWIYSNIVDLGVRSSLSIFTQYIVLVVGLLIALKVMGINLTTLMVLLGGLGVGIGFGLQNIVNNFVSGILLLIERPLRTGDIVNVGGNEGHVSQIGMRSLTIKTWNKQDVIVPNSELITNSFINWTHSDKVLRITLYIGVSYDDDLHKVKRIITDILDNASGILKDPAPSVTLWEFADSSVNFRIDYFFDLIASSGFATRDAILFKIWDTFAEENITIPYPQRDVYVKTIPQAKSEPEPRREELPDWAMHPAKGSPDSAS